MNPSRTVILWDIMDTVVYDPIWQEIPAFFGRDRQTLYEQKHPTAWVDFECSRIDEQTFYEIYLPEGPIDAAGLREVLFDAYRFVDGMEELLTGLHADGVEMHALSNYPVWFEIIEEKLLLSRFLDWSFVSCKTGVRKPAEAAYVGAAQQLGRPLEDCLFIDDREKNCRAAREAGMDAVLFRSTEQVRAALLDRGLL